MRTAMDGAPHMIKFRLHDDGRHTLRHKRASTRGLKLTGFESAVQNVTEYLGNIST